MGKTTRDGGDHLVGGALAHRAVRHARLAEAATAGAAAQHLDAETVLDDLHVGNDGLRDRVGGAKVLHHALVNHGPHVLAIARDRVAVRRAGLIMAHLIEGRHVNAADLRKLAEHLGTGHASVAQFAMALAELDDLLLALADHHAIEERRERLGVVDGRAAADDDGVVLTAIGRMKRDAGKVETLEVVGARHLMRHVEAHDVEGRDGSSALEREQRDSGGAHLIGHVDPRDVAALAGKTRGLVEIAVKNGDALVGQAHLVHVGVDQHAAVLSLGLVQRSPLMVDVARRLFDAGEQRFKLMEAVLIGNSHESSLSGA